MAAALIPVLVNAEVSALPTEVRFVKAAIAGIGGLFHKHVNAGLPTVPPPGVAIDPTNTTIPVYSQTAQQQVLADLKMVEPLLLALAKEFGGITIPAADLPVWEAAVSDAIALVGKVHNLLSPE